MSGIAATNLPHEAQAFLCAERWGESGWRPDDSRGSDYTILFGGKAHDAGTPHFSDGTPSRDGYFGFPQWDGVQTPGGMTHAAGADQFEPDTWKDVCTRLFPPGSKVNFRNPGDQDWSAWLLAKDVYHKATGKDLLAVLRGGDLSGVADALKSTWTSLSESTFSERYSAALAVVQPAPPVPAPPVPSPTPTLGPVPVTVDLAGMIASLEAERNGLQARIVKLNAAIDALKAISST